MSRGPGPLAAAPLWWTPAMMALFVVSLLWKLYCLRRLLLSPLFGYLTADSEAYWTWAQILVRNGWMGHNPFFLGPLYPYLLALLMPTTTVSYVAPLVVQCVLGAATVVLVAGAARFLCAPRFAIVSGLLAAGYSMATFMDLSILSESVLWSMGALFLYLQLRAVSLGPTRAFPAVSGLLIGLMSLARPSFMFLLAPTVVSVASSRGLRGALRGSAIALACAILVCTPVLVRHLVLGHGWILNTYSLGFNAYVGNGPNSTGTYTLIPDAANDELTAAGMEGGADGDGRVYILRKEGVWVSPSASSAWWLERTWAQASAHPLRALRLLTWKGLVGLNHVEASQLDSIDVHERIEGPLGLPWLGSFGVVGVLGLFGLYGMRHSARGHVLLAHAIAVWAPLVLFFVTDRYRHHLALPLLVACGPAIEVLWGHVRSPGTRDPGRVAAFLALLAAGVVVWLPLIRYQRQQIEFAVHQSLGEALLRKGNFVAGESELQQCIAPSMLAQLPLHESTTVRLAVAGVMSSLADSYVERGSPAQGEQVLRSAVELAPEDRELRRNHAMLLAMTGRSREAGAELDTLGAARTLLLNDLLEAARKAVSRSSWTAAEQALRAALDVDSASEAANVVLLRLLRSQGRAPEADALVGRMRSRGVPEAVIARESGPSAESR